MCGVAGFFSSLGREQTRNTVSAMLEIQRHRGPDNTGIWTGSVCGTNIGVGLTRLKILDLSDAANQPMVSADGRHVLVYNGELYNYVELREELTAHGAVFRTDGDTEVVLQALIQWGSRAFSRFNGMWALVFLDIVAGEVMLSRDRFGVKPLYTSADNRGLFISSEIKAILEVTGRKFRITPHVANVFLTQNLLCVSPSTFFSGVEEFPAACWAIMHVDDVGKKPLSPKRYWRIPASSTSCRTDTELIELVRSTFIDSVRLRLRSDVPVGVLLSGGIDSSAISAALHYLNPNRDDIKLISAVGVNGNDEQPFIDIVANHLRRNVEKVRLDYSAASTFDLIGEVSWFNDEPVGSFSTVAHYLLMKRARELGVTVLLSGQGADEILCGYKKYLGFHLQEQLRSGNWLAAARVVRQFLQQRTVLSQLNYREGKRYLPHWLRLPEIDVRGPALLEMNEMVNIGLNGGGVIGRQTSDVESLSVPALVHYEDRMSMAAAREIRLPFLDYRLVSLLVPLPVEYKLRDGWTKWIFRQAMETLLPKDIAWRKDKQHFIVPQNNWFNTELRQELGMLLREDWVTEHLGLVDRKKFRDRYNEYLHKPGQNHRISVKDIFSPVAFELWARRFERYLTQ